MDFKDFLRFHNIFVDIASVVRKFAYYNDRNYLVAISSKCSREQNIKTTAHKLIHIFKNHFFCMNENEEVGQIIQKLKNRL